jgi:hypothetical protein
LFVHRADESGVRDAKFAASGIDARDPHPAEIALPLAAMEEREAPLVMDGFYRCLPQLGASAAKALGVLPNAVSASLCLVSTFSAGPGSTPTVRTESSP